MAKTKHYFFDLDNTLTRSRSLISFEMAEALRKMIDDGYDVVVVSGAKHEQIIKQLSSISEQVAILAQNGNDAESSVGTPLWYNELNWIQKKEIFNLPFPQQEIDNVQDRGCQISYSLIGHNKPLTEKELADPDQKIRKQLLKDWNFSSVQTSIGGTTCIDFYLKNKGENVERYIKEMGWNKSDCLYVGDALYEGGNDATVLEIVKTLQVKNPEDTLWNLSSLV